MVEGSEGESPRVALVTGGARRVGAEIARRLHADGARVIVHYRSAVLDADDLVDALNVIRPGSATALQSDFSEMANVQRFAREALACWGRIDVLVNNASSFFSSPLGDIDERMWNDLVGSNFKAPLFLTQAFAHELRRRCGSVVNITDIHAERPLAGYPLYCAAKGALLTLTRALAIELAPDVRVNAVAPGPIDWPDDGQIAASAQRAIVDHTLLGRTGNAGEIADAVVFLAGRATYVTGQVLNVDGGRSAHL